MTRTGLIFIGGDAPDGRVRHHLPAPDTVVAADSGWAHAVALGYAPNVLVGDFDSISPEHLAQARSSTDVVEFSADKDLTDTEIALNEARSRGCEVVTVVSGGGDRLDHVLAMVHSLAASHARVNAFIGATRLEFASPRNRVALEVNPGSTMSLVPIGGDAVGVSTNGLKWSLNADTLRAGESRGVSNVAVADMISVSVTDGVVAVLCPNFLDNPPHSRREAAP